MKVSLNAIAVLLILVGGIWFLQGINVLPGSFMTGHPQWAIYGGLAFAAGLALLAFANRQRDRASRK